MNPEPRAWMVEIDGERLLCCDNGSYTETTDALRATTFISRDAANFAALHHLGEEGLTRVRLSPLY